jgi:hypothetical protein
MLGEQAGNFREKSPLNNFSTIRLIFANSILIDSIQPRLRKTGNINGKKSSEFEATCKDSKKLPVSWVYKTAKIFSRTGRVRQ